MADRNRIASRQEQVFQCWADGLTQHETAAVLGVSRATVARDLAVIRENPPPVEVNMEALQVGGSAEGVDATVAVDAAREVRKWVETHYPDLVGLVSGHLGMLDLAAPKVEALQWSRHYADVLGKVAETVRRFIPIVAPGDDDGGFRELTESLFRP